MVELMGKYKASKRYRWGKLCAAHSSSLSGKFIGEQVPNRLNGLFLKDTPRRKFSTLKGPVVNAESSQDNKVSAK